MVAKRAFSLYDVEQFLKEAGAEKINEKAILSLEMELQDTVKELVNEAAMYANYAGRKRMIKLSDIDMVNGSRRSVRYMQKRPIRRVKRPISQRNFAARMQPPKIMLVNNVPIIAGDQSNL